MRPRVWGVDLEVSGNFEILSFHSGGFFLNGWDSRTQILKYALNRAGTFAVLGNIKKST